MDNIKIKLNESQLKKYRQALYNFDKYIEDIYSNLRSNELHKGYLINLKDFEEFKKIIYYDIYKNKYCETGLKDINFTYSEKVFKIKQIEFKTSQYFINMLLNENKYIIINTALWRVICENGNENENPINYEINNSYLILHFEDNNQIKLKYNN